MPIGIAAFMLLAPLVLTSTRCWQRRLVYLAIPVSVWHFLWLDRDFITWPLIHAVIVGILLLLRLPFVPLGRKRRGSVE